MSALLYPSVVWMFHGRKLNNLINRIHCRTLKYILYIYDNSESSFEELFLKDSFFKIHHHNLQKI